MQEDTFVTTELEDNFLTAEQEHDLHMSAQAAQHTAANAVRPLKVVPYVRILNSNDPSDCPFDRYMMNKRMAMLEYSRDKKGGAVIALKVLLRSCPQCDRLFIDQNQLLGLKKAGLDITGFDIIGSTAFSRTKGYEKWHPEALKKAVAAVVVPVKKVKTPRKAAGKKSSVAAAAAD